MKLSSLAVCGLTAVTLLAPISWPTVGRAQTCSASVTDIDFGAPNLLSKDPTDALGTLTVTCTRIPVFTVIKMCPGFGEGSGGSIGAARLLRDGSSQTLAYQLYQDSARALGWGSLDDTELGTIPAIILGNGYTSTATATRTLYARLFGGQMTASAGAYVSSFSGRETAFTWSPFFLGASGSCTGFVGTSTIRPAFDVLATPQSACTLSTTDLDFGTVGVLQNGVMAQTSLRIACTAGTAFSVGLDGGQAGTTSPPRRLSSSSGATIAYELYRDAARTQAWGDSAPARIGGKGSGSEIVAPVYGRVPSQATPPPGLYTDRVVATVRY